MANITINNTDKDGWLHISLNDYYNGTNGDSEHYIPIAQGIDRMCVGKIDSVDYIELHISRKQHPLFLTNSSGGDTIKIVDTVNGVAPTSFIDLKNKLLALL